MNQSKNSEKEEKVPKVSIPNILDVICPDLAAEERTPELEIAEDERRGPAFQVTDAPNRDKRKIQSNDTGMTQGD